VDGVDKTIYLKKPSDDIQILEAHLYYDGDDVNLLEQSYSIDKVEEPYDDEYRLNIIANINFQNCKIIQDGKVILENSDGNFSGKNFEQLFKVYKEITVIVRYDNIEQTAELMLSFLEIEEISIFEEQGNFDAEFGDPIFGSFQINIFDIMKKSLYVYKKNSQGGLFSVIHDNKNHVTKIAIGYKFNRDLASTRQKDQRIFDSFRRSYDTSRKPNLPNVTPKSIVDSLKSAFNCPALKTSGEGISSLAFSLTFELEIIGYIEVFDKQFSENKKGALIGSDANGINIRSAGISVSAGLSIEWTYQTIIPVLSIPSYVVFGFGISLDFDKTLK